MTTDRPVHRPIIDVLYVQDCPNYPETLALVQRVGTELGIDAELRTTLIVDQAAAERTRFPGLPDRAGRRPRRRARQRAGRRLHACLPPVSSRAPVRWPA
jgi:hypothetical protein